MTYGKQLKSKQPQQHELDAVARMVAALKVENDAHESGTSPELKRRPKPLYVDDHLLLREYDNLAARGDTCAQTRAALLRSKLGEKERGVRQ